ncbi:sarcosine oxidase subunit alpha family protein [Pseudomonadota bacterium]
MTRAGRLETGGSINRQKPITFRFNGKPYRGYEGDSLASALLANGITVVGRSFKYHRPRGIFTAGEEEPCALVETGEGASRVPTCRAPMVPLTEGLVATSQTGWPSVDFDIGRMIDFTHGLWSAGFYNKTFKWPNWHFWEGLIRKSAGLGRPLTEPDPDHYEQINVHCDLLVCGSGPAGLVAALTAGRAGLRVILVEQAEEFGGSLNWEQYQLNGNPCRDWANEVLDELKMMSHVITLQRTTVTGIYDHKVTTLLQAGKNNDWRECFWTVRPKHILLATGAIEQGLIFPGNDRPGIMLAGAVRHYLNRYAIQPGKRVVVATNNDTAYQTVFDLAREQIQVEAVVDTRKSVSEKLRQRLEDLGTTLHTGARISNTRGSKGIRSVSIESTDGTNPGARKCDLLAVSGGWAPRVHLLAHARGSVRFDEVSQSFLPDGLPDSISIAGSANGTAGLEELLAESARAACSIVAQFGQAVEPPRLPLVTAAIIESRRVSPVTLDTTKHRQWIDLAHDVTLGDAELAVREGYVSVEHFKRYTTTGMSVDQGKTGNLNAFIALGALTGRPAGEIGTTTFRPPYTPVTLGAIAGRNIGEFYAPRRYLPAHGTHKKLNACFEDYGWQRPDYYPLENESAVDAIQREVRTVRTAVGVFDNSPIGKIEVHGPDAAEFLDRLYINNIRSLQNGRVRYGLMLNDNGVIIDDGVCVRLADDHFLVNSTSGAVARIAALMEEWLQCEWPDLQVLIDDVTSHWANFTIAGPRARDVLTDLETDIDLTPATLPHMSVATGTVAGLDARVVRVSFSGEMSFEVNVPAACANGFLDAMLAVGADYGIEPYGIEALMILRTEKGYLHIGSDTDGSSTPDDVGWAQVARNKSRDYIGRRSLSREANQEDGRKQLVGLELLDSGGAIHAGAHLLTGRDRKPPAVTDGWVTSACYSPTLERYIALGVLRSGRSQLGEILTVCDGEERFNVKVASPVFYDPENKRLEN